MHAGDFYGGSHWPLQSFQDLPDQLCHSLHVFYIALVFFQRRDWPQMSCPEAKRLDLWTYFRSWALLPTWGLLLYPMSLVPWQGWSPILSLTPALTANCSLNPQSGGQRRLLVRCACRGIDAYYVVGKLVNNFNLHIVRLDSNNEWAIWTKSICMVYVLQ